jgi:hypothetical protein
MNSFNRRWPVKEKLHINELKQTLWKISLVSSRERERQKQGHALQKTSVPTSSVQHHNVPLWWICHHLLPVEMLLISSIYQITGRLYHSAELVKLENGNMYHEPKQSNKATHIQENWNYLQQNSSELFLSIKLYLKNSLVINFQILIQVCMSGHCSGSVQATSLFHIFPNTILLCKILLHHMNYISYLVTVHQFVKHNSLGHE